MPRHDYDRFFTGPDGKVHKLPSGLRTHPNSSGIRLCVTAMGRGYYLGTYDTFLEADTQRDIALNDLSPWLSKPHEDVGDMELALSMGYPKNTRLEALLTKLRTDFPRDEVASAAVEPLARKSRRDELQRLGGLIARLEALVPAMERLEALTATQAKYFKPIPH